MKAVNHMNIYIKPERKKQLKEYGKETGMSMSAIIDVALGLYFGKAPIPSDERADPEPPKKPLTERLKEQIFEKKKDMEFEI
jgi:hypothetical protein